MSTATDPHGHDVATDAHGAEAHEEHKPDSYYVKIALLLAALTAIEVWLSYVDVGPLFLPSLFILMAIKFVMVALFFMHLKFDSRWFNLAFWTGLVLTVLVYAAALSTFKFFMPA